MTSTFAERSVHYAAKSKDLRDAITRTNEATTAGRLVGLMLSGPAWYFSGAPWWAIPVSVVMLTWVCGKIVGLRVAKKLEAVLRAKYPELGL